MTPAVSAREVLALLAKLGNVADRIVLIGGQAVNFWSEFYLAQGRAPRAFLGAPFGMRARDIERNSVRLVLDDAGSPTGAAYRVMHPVDCLERRVPNVAGLADAYDTPRGRAVGPACRGVRPR